MENSQTNIKNIKEYDCPNCEEDKPDYRGRCPKCEYEDKTLKNN